MAMQTTLTRCKFRDYYRKIVAISGILGGFNPTPEEEAVLALFFDLAENDELFAEWCDVLGIPSDPV
jgi:hypothetical protein